MAVNSDPRSNDLEEFAHRLSNVLAMVQAMARLTFHHEADNEEAKAAFLDRIQAYAESHEILFRQGWGPISVETLLDHVLKNQDLPASQLDWNGSALKISPRGAIALCLAVNELCMNARRYGALSVSHGKVRVSWRADPNNSDLVEFWWLESGGPAVREPTRKGFGTVMLREALSAELCGKCDLDFKEEGVEFRCAFPRDLA